MFLFHILFFIILFQPFQSLLIKLMNFFITFLNVSYGIQEVPQSVILYGNTPYTNRLFAL